MHRIGRGAEGSSEPVARPTTNRLAVWDVGPRVKKDLGSDLCDDGLDARGSCGRERECSTAFERGFGAGPAVDDRQLWLLACDAGCDDQLGQSWGLHRRKALLERVPKLVAEDGCARSIVQGRQLS